jgi:ectoine hydroxylase-related dioxygenase (phytanoyl-CoA dioxygenase family)
MPLLLLCACSHCTLSPFSFLFLFMFQDADLQLALCSRRTAYASFWCPLDDVSPANGTLTLVPWHGEARADSDLDAVDPASDPATAVTVTLRAGDAVLFDSTVWHRSGPNATDADRRVLYAQYSAQPVTPHGTGGRSPLRFAVPM